MEIEPGALGTADVTVADEDTATAFGSGDVPVLATPRIVALMEAAAVAALDGRLAEGATTVGVHVDVRHVAPSRIGDVIMATATVVTSDQRRIEFAVEAREGELLVAHGTHTRVVVDRRSFGG